MLTLQVQFPSSNKPPTRNNPSHLRGDLAAASRAGARLREAGKAGRLGRRTRAVWLEARETSAGCTMRNCARTRAGGRRKPKGLGICMGRELRVFAPDGSVHPPADDAASLPHSAIAASKRNCASPPEFPVGLRRGLGCGQRALSPAASRVGLFRCFLRARAYFKIEV